ncbi:MAG TPA: S8 family serine peptidase [Gemmataceae bacterium]|nr:S8 family serine peptidase [Gemmataceae bacterium]
MANAFHLSLQASDGAPLARVTTRLSLGGKLRSSQTDENGKAVCQLPSRPKKGQLEIGPLPMHWSIGEVVDFAKVDHRDFVATRLPLATDGLGWWHRVIGLRRTDPTLGRGISIGIIDSGCANHPALGHIHPFGSFLAGNLPQPGIDDEVEHGTHVCGIIGARPSAATEYSGIAPAAELVVARVETAASGGSSQLDIANALDALVTHGVHLVNLSLGARKLSNILSDSIINAWLNGVVCFAAAGNLGGNLLWPAQHEKVIAVTALGRLSETCSGSLSNLLLSDATQMDTDLDVAFAEFCCRGPQTRCCAPGIGIISTIGTATGGSWGDLSGTSMASPMALATLAAVLGRDSAYLGADADEDRASLVLETLENHCRPLSFDPDVQGNGLVMLDISF